MKKPIVEITTKKNQDTIFYIGNVVQLAHDKRYLVMIVDANLGSTMFSGVQISNVNENLGKYANDYAKSAWIQFEGEIKITI